MSQVSAVRGPVDVADLGPTYMHEHIFVLTSDVQQNYPGEWGSEDARITDAVTKLGALAAQGVRTIVDPTVVGLGRKPFAVATATSYSVAFGVLALAAGLVGIWWAVRA
jgi:predicted metal-dependent phosphotriesterase family hydrolase